MTLLATLGLAFGLGMDAFSVAVASGGVLGSVSIRQAFRLSFHFGLFQFAMPVVGWLIGSLVVDQIKEIDHWIAFALLGAIGARMIWEAVKSEPEAVPKDPTRGMSLVMLSVATSIDALAVGLTLAFIGTPILPPSILIGLVAANMTLLGLLLGRYAGRILGGRVEIAGGLILIGIGLKILLEHLYA